jgi:hypothetical protein
LVSYGGDSGGGGGRYRGVSGGGIGNYIGGIGGGVSGVYITEVLAVSV